MLTQRVDDWLFDHLGAHTYWRLRYRWGWVKRRVKILPMLPLTYAILTAGCFMQAKEMVDARRIYWGPSFWIDTDDFNGPPPMVDVDMVDATSNS